MGGGYSSSRTTVYQACHAAYPNGQISLGKLQKALDSSTPDELNQSMPPHGWTALECAILIQEPQLDAVKVLLKYGADPFSNGSKAFHDAPLGLAMRYERIEIMKALLAPIRSRAAFERLAAGIMAPPEGLVSQWGVAVKWVEVDGRTAEVVPGRSSLRLSIASAIDEDAKSKHCVKYEDGTEEVVGFDKLNVLPVVSADVKPELLASATANGCPEDILVQFRSLKAGHYGQMPRQGGSIAAAAMMAPLG
eukprot:gnl/MRDRNA2_/MRDRNA2_199940_c0_seq1.p1 gnl/MRDRNA2_/MRDRNA2_199940_c0~~gnl/MRDRNA2_/MRDRNA2_199940_c0_seq1.p1  ORF type:complete len:250 (-),score=59.31 gnl/MRDRNA2_/MRDRNA2_199940_c0_seq1:101-850(-)